MASTPATLVDGTSTPASALPGHHNHHSHLNSHLHAAGQRIRHLFRPDGKRVHTARNPDEARRMSEILRAKENEDFDLVLHGSPEHIEALRYTHSHHEDRHRQLKEEHPELAAEFEHVLRELDALSAEIHMISEHAVQLDANFNKYGYSAHLRTRDSGEESSSSGDSTFDKGVWQAGRKLGETMRFYQKPIVRQYFHKGLIWRAREAQEVASYELFIDLFYVGIIAITGDTAAEHPDGQSLLCFVITFIMSWNFWTDINLLISWFDSDDVLRRCSVLFILTCLLGFTTNMADAFKHTYVPLVAFYLSARLFLMTSLFWYAYLIPMVRGAMIGNGIIMLIPAALWIGSIHVEEPSRQGLIWTAIFFDLFGNSILLLVQRPTAIQQRIPSKLKERLEFFPATNIEHRIERTNGFVTLVFGSCVLGILYQSSDSVGINAFFGKAVLGLIQAFSFNWIYFEIDSFNLHTHAIRRHVLSAMVWFTVHIPFIMSFVLGAGALAVLVRAHDCPDADVESLYESFIPRSEEEISEGLQWYYCGGLGISFLCLAIIAWSHTHRKIPNQRIKKNLRLLFRVIVAIIVICLPLAHLNSLELVATTTGLTVCVLVLELVGSTCWGESFWRNTNCRRNNCSYSAKCNVRKEELEKSLKEGTVLNVEEIAKREKNEEGF